MWQVLLDIISDARDQFTSDPLKSLLQAWGVISAAMVAAYGLLRAWHANRTRRKRDIRDFINSLSVQRVLYEKRENESGSATYFAVEDIFKSAGALLSKANPKDDGDILQIQNACNSYRTVYETTANPPGRPPKPRPGYLNDAQWNALLAARVSILNAAGALCNRNGVDATPLTQAIAALLNSSAPAQSLQTVAAQLTLSPPNTVSGFDQQMMLANQIKTLIPTGSTIRVTLPRKNGITEKGVVTSANISVDLIGRPSIQLCYTPEGTSRLEIANLLYESATVEYGPESRPAPEGQPTQVVS